MKSGGVGGEMEPPSKRTTLMYDYTIIFLEPLHCSSLSVSSSQPQNSFHRQIFHFSPSVLFAFLAPFPFVRYHCEVSGRGLYFIRVCAANNNQLQYPSFHLAQMHKFLLPVSSPLPWFFSSARLAPFFASFMWKMSSSIFGS